MYEFIKKKESTKVFAFFVFKEGVKGMIGEGTIRPGRSWPGMAETD